MEDGHCKKGRPKGPTRRERGRPHLSGRQRQRRSVNPVFPEAAGTTREERRRQKSTVIRLAKDTVNSLQRIQRERDCDSLDDVLDILIERYEIHQVVSPGPRRQDQHASFGIPASSTSTIPQTPVRGRGFQLLESTPMLSGFTLLPTTSTPITQTPQPSPSTPIRREPSSVAASTSTPVPPGIAVIPHNEERVPETPVIERWKTVVPPISTTSTAWEIKLPDESDDTYDDDLETTYPYEESDANSSNSEESSDMSEVFYDDMETSWIASPAPTTDTEAEGINDYLQHVEFQLNVANDEVELFDYGEELEHELNFAGVATETFGQGEEETEEVEVDEFIRVETVDESKDDTTIAFGKCLKKLANLQVPKTCKVSNCSSAIDLEMKQVGTAMYLKWTCKERRHINKRWCSQPRFKFGQHVGDYRLACAILFTGSNYSKVAKLLQAMKMKPVAQTAYTRIHGHYAVPAIERHWEEINNGILEQLTGKDIVVLGDGRMDSPGYNAQYCTYTMMENSSKDIVAVIVVDKREVEGKSTNMERRGFIRAMEYLKDRGMAVEEVVTDAHVQITSTIKKSYPETKHSLDVWHGAKNLGKEIIAASAETECGILLPWVSHITNHFWYCIKKARGTYEGFMAKWRGVLQHVSGSHVWLPTDGYGAGQCDHGPLGEREDDDKELIPRYSKAHRKLRTIIFDTHLLGKIRMYLNFRSTSELDSFNNKILGYVSKRHAFQYPGYRARCLVAALDYQENKGQEPLLTKSGEYRLHRLYRKRSTHWDVVYAKDKTFNYVGDLLDLAVHDRITNPKKYQQKIPMSAYDPRQIATHSGKVPPPPTKELFEAKKSRFDKE